ncbi:CpsD/CapB family tyrosine-protein kinase [Sphingomonas mucosissima]|uniref:CpsD/CapB family tyrosine-protein kinase n=1 Tax=Sphingomonas mucosissima TaxID=370959 RepID=UPI00112505A7|nr:CpsD/CapB family tyrosine-protein kinase [Sphingomonas mucosissima]
MKPGESIPVEAIQREDGLACPPAGELPFSFSRRLVCLSAPDGAAAASYRSLQTHLFARHVGEGRRGLALCSPAAATGCTTVAVNLAIACAQAGINTVVVDANLVRPAVHDFIRQVTEAAGLTEMLSNDPGSQVDQICRDVRPNLSVLFAGRRSGGTQTFVAQRRLKEVVDHCLRSFDFTIIDAPPASEGTNARHVAMLVRYAMMVARRDVTMLADLKKAADDLVSDRVKILGSFLTDF